MKVKRALGAAAFVGSSIVLKDISSRQYLDSRVRVVLERMGKPKNHLVVFLPGMMQDIRKQVDPILSAFESKYDLMYVYPGSELYLLDKVVETVVQQVLVAMEESKYQSVLLVPFSMTGVAAAQIAIELDRNPSFEAAIDMVPDCTPLGRKSLRTPLRSVLSLLVKLPVGKLSNLVPLVRWMAVPPREDRLTPEVDHEKLREAFEKSTDTPVSRWLSELASFIDHDPFPPGSLSFVRFAAFIDATLDDDTVDNGYAFSVWAPAFDGKLTRYPVRAAHTATLEAPREYREVYQKILDDISRV